jgi:adhesin transport system outer membrane protein
MLVKRILKYACVSLLLSSSLHALSLKDSVEKVMATNPEIIAEKNNQQAFRKYIDEREANYLPRIDIDGRIEQSSIERDYDNPTGTQEDGSAQEDGYNFGIALNQMLYDGDLTPSQVREAKHNDLANKYRTTLNIENVVSDTVSAYTGLIQYKEMLQLTRDMIETNQDNLLIAREKEAISGEVLETYQVESKLSFVKEKYLEEKDLQSSRISTFKRYVGVEPDGKECRPFIDESKIPSSLQEAVELAVLRNSEILEQIERVKAQREKIAQADAKFLPNLSLELKALTDNDLSLDENGKEDQAFGRINLAWNLYNGGGDHAVSQQEELFLAEQKERLDAITNKIVESVKVNYQRYNKNKDRINVLKDYVVANENIVQVYKSEFEAGTRTFVDILDAQTVLYEAKKSLLNREYELYSNYYEILNSFSMLSDTILTSETQSCSNEINTTTTVANNITNEEVVELKPVKTAAVSDELSALLGDETVEEKVEDTVESQVIETQEVQASENFVDSSSVVSYTSFLDAPEKSYTLNVTTTKGLAAANKFVINNGLDDNNSFRYEFGPGMKSAKVIYGIFSSVKEAKEAMKSLPASVLAHKPYIDNVSKHKKLYAKYH